MAIIREARENQIGDFSNPDSPKFGILGPNPEHPRKFQRKSAGSEERGSIFRPDSIFGVFLDASGAMIHNASSLPPGVPPGAHTGIFGTARLTR